MFQVSLPATLQNLVATIERIYSSQLHELDLGLSRVTISSGCRKFVVNRMGSTGSTWLAKLLNSHPDVFCSHEGVVSRVYPAQSYDEHDITRFVEALAGETAHGAYSAIGDVGSVWAGHVSSLHSFTTAMLVRHPARLLRTRLQVVSHDQSFTRIAPQDEEILREVWGIDLCACEPIDQIFLHDLLVFASQVWTISKVDILIRIEDMHCLDHCQTTLRALTGAWFPRRLILNANRNRVNQRTAPSERIGDVVASFSKRQRAWYGTLLADAAPFFGYSLWDDEITAPRVMVVYPSVGPASISLSGDKSLLPLPASARISL